jgi:hypothetical protein
MASETERKRKAIVIFDSEEIGVAVPTRTEESGPTHD